MTATYSRRNWLRATTLAAAALPVSRWALPDTAPPMPAGLNPETTIRLAFNENAYGPGDAARQAVMDSLSEGNRYPRQSIMALREEIARREGLTPDHVIVTAGSTELLGLAGMTYGLRGGELLACHPTFDFLLIFAERLGATWNRVPLDANYQYDLDAMAGRVGQDTKLIFVCNPNNPTGVEIPTDRLRDFVATHGGTYPVYVDEAYVELSPNGRKSSMAGLVDQYKHLIIGRTFSKVHGLAGLRIGYGLAHPETISRLEDMHQGRSISLSSASAAAALASLRDADYESYCRMKIIEGRTMVCSAFDKMGVRYLPSAANFVFFQNDNFTMDPVEAMKKENIWIRSYKDVPGWTRVSIGTTEEMGAFIRAAEKYIS